MADDPWEAVGVRRVATTPEDTAQPADPWAAVGVKRIGQAPANGTPQPSQSDDAREATLEAPRSPSSVLQSHHDAEAAALQGVSPHALSKYFPAEDHSSSPAAGAAPENAPKLLGHVEEMDWGPAYKGPAGDYLRINPETDFIARHPDTGRLAVYGRTPQTDENRFVSASRLMMPGLAVGPVTNSIRAVPEAAEVAGQALSHSSAAPPASLAARRLPGTAVAPVGAQLAAERAADIAQDIEAFDRFGVRKPPIAFTQGPMAGVGKMVSRIPYLGEPINSALDQALVGARDAARKISAEMAPNATVEQAGHTLQQGLDRFRTAGVRDIEPSALAELGIQPRAPGRYVGELEQPGLIRLPPEAGGAVMPLDPAQHIVLNDAGRMAVYENAARGAPEASAGARQRAEQAAPIREQLGGGYAQTTRGVEVPAARSLDQTIMGRRGAPDLSDAELGRLIRAPSQDTSFLVRAEALYEKARRSVPSFFRMDERAESIRLAAPNTRAALRGIEDNIANQIAGQGTIGGELAERLRNARSHFSLDDLFAVRTEVGRQLSNFSPYQQSLNRGQLNGLYGALLRDIEVSLQDIANRAYLRTRVSNNQPNYVRPEVAMRADQTLRDFRTADRFYRASMARMDRFAKVAGTDNPQAAVGIMMRAALDGTKGDIGMLRTAMNVLRPEERQQFAALVLDQMGKPKPNAAGMVEKAGFSPATFMTTWKAMNPAAKAILFNGEFRKPMDDLVRVVGRLNNVEAMANTSRSGTDVINFLTLAGGAAAAYSHNLPILVGLTAPTLAISGLMSRPWYVRWIAQYAKWRADFLEGTMKDAAPRGLVLINQLNRMAVKDPALLPAARAVAAEHGVGQRREQDQPVEQQPRLH